MVEGASDRAAAFARSRIPSGPIDIAPMVEIVEEFAIHGHVAADGAVRGAQAVRYTANARPGASPASGRARSVGVSTALQGALDRVAETLVGLGYFGPFGIDAFTWRDADGAVQLRSVSEVNARYTMHFSMCAPELVGLEHTR